MSKRVLILAGLMLVLLLSLLPLRAVLFGRDADVSQASTAGQPTSTVTPTTVEATPTAVEVTPTTPPFAFPDGSEIAGTDVGGLSVEAASASVSEALEAFERTVILRGPGLARTLGTQEFLELPDAEELVDRARSRVKEGEPVKLPVKAAVDDRAVRTAVEEIAPRVELPMETSVLSDVKALTQTFTFAYRPGRRVDVEQSARRLAKAVERADGPDRIDLVVEEITADRPPMAELERVLREHAGFWDGVAGFYVHDLESGETVAYNADTVFSGASVMKVPIMIFAYSRLGSLDETQRTWMHKMIIDSENIEANSLLAAAVGGAGTEDALRGVDEMSTMLQELGLEHTYQLIPYESAEWLIQQARLPGGGPSREGEAPYTAADGYLRTTPGEMGRLFVMLDECARGTGPLLEKVGGKLTGELCREMIDWLQRPHDAERMMAGLPAGTVVAHKGGWINDMQSDVGIVESPGGRYVAAIYIWRDGYVSDIHVTPSPYLGDFSHTIYTFFNPRPVTAEGTSASGED